MNIFDKELPEVDKTIPCKNGGFKVTELSNIKW